MLNYHHVSQILGTALGDRLADTRYFGYERGALVFAAALLVVVALYFWTSISRVILFWVAFILTRPLRATVETCLTNRSTRAAWPSIGPWLRR